MPGGLAAYISGDAPASALDGSQPPAEAMLVQAYLCHNPRAAIVLSTPLLRHHDEECLRHLLPGYRSLDREDFDTHHGSLWFRVLEGAGGR